MYDYDDFDYERADKEQRLREQCQAFEQAAGRALTLNSDGAAHQNPYGVAGWGFVAQLDGAIIHRAHGPMPKGTSNNEAEYQGAIEALRWAAEFAATNRVGHVELRADSQLVIYQATGEYQCKAAHLRGYLSDLHATAEEVGVPVAYTWVERESNAEADAEAGLGLLNALGGDTPENRAKLEGEAERIKNFKQAKINRKEKKQREYELQLLIAHARAAIEVEFSPYHAAQRAREEHARQSSLLQQLQKFVALLDEYSAQPSDQREIPALVRTAITDFILGAIGGYAGLETLLDGDAARVKLAAEIEARRQRISEIAAPAYSPAEIEAAAAREKKALTSAEKRVRAEHKSRYARPRTTPSAPIETISYAKLPDGSWGVSIKNREVAPGETVMACKKDGSTKEEVIEAIIEVKQGRKHTTRLCSVEARDAKDTASAAKLPEPPPELEPAPELPPITYFDFGFERALNNHLIGYEKAGVILSSAQIEHELARQRAYLERTKNYESVWGVRVAGLEVAPGDIVEVQKRDGEMKREKIGRIVERRIEAGKTVLLCEIEPLPRISASFPLRRPADCYLCGQAMTISQPACFIADELAHPDCCKQDLPALLALLEHAKARRVETAR